MHTYSCTSGRRGLGGADLSACNVFSSSASAWLTDCHPRLTASSTIRSLVGVFLPSSSCCTHIIASEFLEFSEFILYASVRFLLTTVTLCFLELFRRTTGCRADANYEFGFLSLSLFLLLDFGFLNKTQHVARQTEGACDGDESN